MNEKFNYDCLNDETPRLFTMDLSSLKFTDKANNKLSARGRRLLKFMEEHNIKSVDVISGNRNDAHEYYIII